MGKISRNLCVGLLTIEATSAWGHEGCTPGHHWECPGYVNEMRLQVVLMGLVLVAGALVNLIRQSGWRRRQ